jgi:hypothetical protein
LAETDEKKGDDQHEQSVFTEHNHRASFLNLKVQLPGVSSFASEPVEKLTRTHLRLTSNIAVRSGTKALS